MPSHGLIVIVSIRSGSEERLRQTLNRIGNDIKGKRLDPNVPEPHIDFPRSRTIHFARMAVIEDPDRGPARQRLFLATDYDGDWREHVMELFAITSGPEAIWGCCVGYSGRDRFAEFIRSHTVEPQAYYIAFRGLTLPGIRRLLQLRAQSSKTPAGPSPASFLSSVATIAGDLTRLPFAALDVPGLLLRRGPIHALQAARRVNATLDRVWWVWLFNRLTLNVRPPPSRRYSSTLVDTATDCAPATTQDEVVSKETWPGAPPEDLVSQNQLTLVTVVQPDQVRQLQAVLEVIGLYARRLAAQGSLVGISTIHTVRWALIDGGTRLVMASNYDGTWEHYIDEFAEMILSGLDALWEGCYGFPELGAQDVVALKRFLRCHQVPANVFYSAYPEGTVLNIADALTLERGATPQPQTTQTQASFTGASQP
jgi:hypothetical protein